MKKFKTVFCHHSFTKKFVDQLTASDLPGENRGSHSVDPRPVAKTPKCLGVNAETAMLRISLRNARTLHFLM